MEVERTFYKNCGALRFVVVVGKDLVKIPSHLGKVERTIIRAVLITKRFKHTQGMAVFNPNDEFDYKFGVNLAIGRAVNHLRARLIEEEMRKARGRVTKLLAGNQVRPAKIL